MPNETEKVITRNQARNNLDQASSQVYTEEDRNKLEEEHKKREEDRRKKAEDEKKKEKDVQTAIQNEKRLLYLERERMKNLEKELRQEREKRIHVEQLMRAIKYNEYDDLEKTDIGTENTHPVEKHAQTIGRKNVDNSENEEFRRTPVILGGDNLRKTGAIPKQKEGISRNNDCHMSPSSNLPSTQFKNIFEPMPRLETENVSAEEHLRWIRPQVDTSNIPTFNGTSSMNPIEFLEKLEWWLLDQRVTQEERLGWARRSLRGEAKLWADVFCDQINTYNEFEDKLLNKYWSRERQREIVQKLYKGKYVKIDENNKMSTYFLKMLKIAKYIHQLSQEEIIDLIIDHFPIEISRNLFSLGSRNAEDVYATLERFDSLETRKLRDRTEFNQRSRHISEDISNRQLGRFSRPDQRQGYRQRQEFSSHDYRWPQPERTRFNNFRRNEYRDEQNYRRNWSNPDEHRTPIKTYQNKEYGNSREANTGRYNKEDQHDRRKSNNTGYKRNFNNKDTAYNVRTVGIEEKCPGYNTIETEVQVHETKQRKSDLQGDNIEGLDDFTDQEIQCHTVFYEKEEQLEKKPKISPMISAEIEGVKCDILIDSGCQVTCLSKIFYDEIKKQNQSIVSLPVTNVSIVGAIGNKCKKIKEQTFVTLKLANMKFEIVCLVVENLIHKCILGTDWMSKNKVILDFDKEKLVVEKK